MPVQKFITTEKLVEYLDQEVGALLSYHDVYDIGNMGGCQKIPKTRITLVTLCGKQILRLKQNGSICLVMGQ